MGRVHGRLGFRKYAIVAEWWLATIRKHSVSGPLAVRIKVIFESCTRKRNRNGKKSVCIEIMFVHFTATWVLCQSLVFSFSFFFDEDLPSSILTIG